MYMYICLGPYITPQEQEKHALSSKFTSHPPSPPNPHVPLLTSIRVIGERSSTSDLWLFLSVHTESESSGDLSVWSGSRTGLLLQSLLQFNLTGREREGERYMEREKIEGL